MLRGNSRLISGGAATRTNSLQTGLLPVVAVAATLDEHIRAQLSELGHSGWAVRFHRVAVRIYFVLPATEEHRIRLMERTRSFLNTEWARKEHCRFAKTLS